MSQHVHFADLCKLTVAEIYPDIFEEDVHFCSACREEEVLTDGASCDHCDNLALQEASALFL